ncbi:hemerythrin domain-containing protein [uncultured Thiocystis sp.]|jgi:hemerythrin-like domain-containing protein|uniref:hemerythrin domain-containing protein n=1 Tax=uncultured Thiocystis sp. TaxID=1202134 RepID=UPI0025DB1420|nr:hemerythrin domain-containing protein [uncultured Thiocystis sp.]
MHSLMQRLLQDHARQTQLLDLLDHLLDRFHEGAEPDYDLMNEMLEYLDSYADIVHHPTEDLVFQRVLDKGVAPPEPFELLLRQHPSLSQVCKRFRQSLNGILNEEVLLREDVEADGRELVASLRTHMLMEDNDAYPLALQALDDGDWAALAAQSPTAEDPLFGTPDPVRFRALYRYLSAQAESETTG